MSLDVLLVTGSLPPFPCGVGHYTRRLVEALGAEGAAAGVEVPSRAADLPRLRSRVREAAPRVVHMMYPARGYRRALFPVRIPPAVAPVPLLLQLHEYRAAHPLRRLFMRRLLAGAWRVVVSTEGEARALAGYGPIVLPVPSNVIADPAAAPPPPPPRGHPDPIAVVFFGFPERSKRVDLLIEAVARVERCRLRLIGGTPPDLAAERRRLEALARRRGVEAEFTGELADDRVVAELQGADLCVLPFAGGASARHTTLVTALQAGVPVVTTAGPDVPRGLEHGRAAWLVSANDAGALAQGIRELSADPVARARLSEGGRAFAASVTWRSVARSFRRIYEEAPRPAPSS